MATIRTLDSSYNTNDEMTRVRILQARRRQLARPPATLTAQMSLPSTPIHLGGHFDDPITLITIALTYHATITVETLRDYRPKAA